MSPLEGWIDFSQHMPDSGLSYPFPNETETYGLSDGDKKQN